MLKSLEARLLTLGWIFFFSYYALKFLLSTAQNTPFKNIWLGKTSPFALMFLEFELNSLHKLLKEENSWRVKSQESFEIWDHPYKGLVFKGSQSAFKKSGNRISSKSSMYIPVNVCLGSSQSSTPWINYFYCFHYYHSVFVVKLHLHKHIFNVFFILADEKAHFYVSC